MKIRTFLFYLSILCIAFFTGVLVDAFCPLWIKLKFNSPDIEVTNKEVVPKSVGRFDAQLGWALRPGARAISTKTGESVEYVINSEGFRDEPITRKKPSGEFRILLLGDSRTFGFGVRINNHFTTGLEAYFRNVQVINAGVSGYGLDQNLIMLRNIGLKFNPDIVILYASHYGDHRHMHSVRFGHNKPRFRIIGDELIPEKVELDEAVADPAPPQSKELDNKNLENLDFKNQLYSLGTKLVVAMQQVSEKSSARFILITEYERSLFDRLQGSMMILDVRHALSARNLQLPNGLGHINAAGNAILAFEIARFLQIHQLIPKNHHKE